MLLFFGVADVADVVGGAADVAAEAADVLAVVEDVLFGCRDILAEVVDGVADVAASARVMAHFGETIEPNMEMHERYKDIAEVQQRLYPQLKEVFEDLHAIAERYPSTKPESPKAEL